MRIVKSINWLYYLAVILAAFLLVFFIYFKVQEPTKHTSRLSKIQALSKQAIAWSLVDIYNQPFQVAPRKNRKYIFVNLWATWCPPCIEELPSLSELAEKTYPETLILAISTEPREKIIKFLKNSVPDISPHLRIVSLSKEEKARIFPEDMLPVTYIFDHKGFLTKKELGSKQWETLIPLIKGSSLSRLSFKRLALMRY